MDSGNPDVKNLATPSMQMGYDMLGAEGPYKDFYTRQIS
jgi:hypothetical protein